MSEMIIKCENCQEQYTIKIHPSEIADNKVESYCPKCRYPNTEDIYDN